ncbi:MAG: hypothetical protein QHH09_00115 [Microgenomates group bacterium]|nr:hypothetical protein [Microgenomates group bacterium]
MSRHIEGFRTPGSDDWPILPAVYPDMIGPVYAREMKMDNGGQGVLVGAEDPQRGAINYQLNLNRYGEIQGAFINWLQPDDTFIYFEDQQTKQGMESVPTAYFYDPFSNWQVRVGLTDAQPAFFINWAGRVTIYPVLEAKDDQLNYPRFGQYFLLGNRPVRIERTGSNGLVVLDLVMGPDIYDMTYDLFTATFPAPQLNFPWSEIERLLLGDHLRPFSLMRQLFDLGFSSKIRKATVEETIKIDQLIAES